MELAEAKRKIHQILEEEQRYPTVSYRFIPGDGTNHWAEVVIALNAAQGHRLPEGHDAPLLMQRRKRPRTVTQSPELYHFESANFQHLLALFQQVLPDERAQFVAALVALVPLDASARRAEYTPSFPAYKDCTSHLPLVLEFCIRTGHVEMVLEALRAISKPTVGLAILLRQLEEIIAVNFNVLSDAELEEIPRALTRLMEVAKAQSTRNNVTRPVGQRMPSNPLFRPSYKIVGVEMEAAIGGIKEGCRKARFYYLRDQLQQESNLEIELDKKVVVDYLAKMGFSPLMVGALNAAEGDYKSTSTPFQLKNCLSHLRSFLEHLHRQTARAVAAAAGETIKDRWGETTNYLKLKGLFTQQHENFSTSLYTLISDESVHPLGAEREYARLLRNVVIEYGVMFLSMLDKRGVRIKPLDSA